MRDNETCTRFVTASELLEVQAKNEPNAPAVLFNGSTLSYGELNGRANRLARVLARRGVGVETLVGIGVQNEVVFSVQTTKTRLFRLGHVFYLNSAGSVKWTSIASSSKRSVAG